jgi:DNA replication and repair protein RecF
LIVKELHLRHYRNYGSCELFFKPGIHLFIGNNAQGKTNLLEALYVLAFGKSHRTSKDKELIKWREDYALLQARIQTRNSEIPLSQEAQRQRRTST